MTGSSIGGTDLVGKGRHPAGKSFVSAKKGAANSLRLSVFNSSGSRSEENIPLMPQTEVTFDGQQSHGESQFLEQKLPHTVRLRTSSLTSDASSHRSKGVDSGNSSLIDSSSTDSYPDFGGGRSRTASTSRSYQNLTTERFDVHENFYAHDGSPPKIVPDDLDLDMKTQMSPETNLDLTVTNSSLKKFEDCEKCILVEGVPENRLDPLGKLSQSVMDCANTHSHFRKPKSRDFSSDKHVCHGPGQSLTNITEIDVSRHSSYGGFPCKKDDGGERCEDETKLIENVGNVEFRRAFSTGNIFNAISLESLSSRNLNGSRAVQQSPPPSCSKATQVFEPSDDSSASTGCPHFEPTQITSTEKALKFCADKIKPKYSLIPQSETDVELWALPSSRIAEPSRVKYLSEIADCSHSLSVCVCCPSCSFSKEFQTPKDHHTVSPVHDPSEPSTTGSEFDHDEKATQSVSAAKGHTANLQSVLGYGVPWSFSAINIKTKNAGDHDQPLQVLVPKLIKGMSLSPQDKNTSMPTPHMKHSLSDNELVSCRDLTAAHPASPSCSPHGQISTAWEDTGNVSVYYGGYVPGCEGSESNKCHRNLCCLGKPSNPFEGLPPNAFSNTSHKHGTAKNIPSHQERYLHPQPGNSTVTYLHSQPDNSDITYRNHACESKIGSNYTQHSHSDAYSSSQGNPVKTQLCQYPIVAYEHCRRVFARMGEGHCQQQTSMPMVFPNTIHKSAVQTNCTQASSSLEVKKLSGALQAESTAGHGSWISAPDCLDEHYQTGMTLNIPMTCFEPDFFSPQNVSPGSHHSMPSSINSGQGGNNQPSLQNTSQIDLIKAGNRQMGRPLVNANREIPDYKILCMVAAIFNPILGMLGYFCNCYARQNFSAYRYNRANSFYMASIILSTTGIFLTLTGAALFTAHTVTMTQNQQMNKSMSALALSCYNTLAEGDESFKKFFEMDHKLYCELSQKLKIMDALKHYQILDEIKRKEHFYRNKNSQNLTLEGDSLNYTSPSSLRTNDTLDNLPNKGTQTVEPHDVNQLDPTDLVDFQQTEGVIMHDTVQSSEDNKPVIAPGLEGEYQKYQSGLTHVKIQPKTP